MPTVRGGAYLLKDVGELAQNVLLQAVEGGNAAGQRAESTVTGQGDPFGEIERKRHHEHDSERVRLVGSPTQQNSANHPENRNILARRSFFFLVLASSEKSKLLELCKCVFHASITFAGLIFHGEFFPPVAAQVRSPPAVTGDKRGFSRSPC